MTAKSQRNRETLDCTFSAWETGGPNALKDRMVKLPILIEMREGLQSHAFPVGRSRYERRHLAFHGLWNFDSIDVKVYGISLSADGIDGHKLEAACQYLRTLTQKIDDFGGSEKVGFVIIHAETDATRLLLSWWANPYVRYQLLASSDSSSGIGFGPVAPAYASCVWDQIVINGECSAWVRAMSHEHPNKEFYLDDCLAHGTY